MKVKVPRWVRIGALNYELKFTPHLKVDENWLASCNQRKGLVEIDPAIGVRRDLSFLHEVVHMIDLNYGCILDEQNIDRLAHGFAEFIEKNLDIELDWSDIKEK